MTTTQNTIPESLASSLSASLAELFYCEQKPSGNVQVSTPFLQQDPQLQRGNKIRKVDVFVVPTETGWAVTDHGGILTVLDIPFPPDIHDQPEQVEMINEICVACGVRVRGRKLWIDCDKETEIADAVCRVAQAVAHISHVRTGWLRQPYS